jgi:hypothetical protein
MTYIDNHGCCDSQYRLLKNATHFVAKAFESCGSKASGLGAKQESRRYSLLSPSRWLHTRATIHQVAVMAKVLTALSRIL